MCLSPCQKASGGDYETAFSNPSAIASRKAPENSAGYLFFSGLCDHTSLLNSLTGALYSPQPQPAQLPFRTLSALLLIAHPVSPICFQCQCCAFSSWQLSFPVDIRTSQRLTDSLHAAFVLPHAPVSSGSSRESAFPLTLYGYFRSRV